MVGALSNPVSLLVPTCFHGACLFLGGTLVVVMRDHELVAVVVLAPDGPLWSHGVILGCGRC